MKLFKQLFISFCMFVSCFNFAEVSVIVNAGNSSSIDDKLVKNIFLGKAKAFSNGETIDVFTLPDNLAETESFRQMALSKSNSQFKSYWSKLAFTGKGTPAKEFANDDELINAVKNNVNAIGFIDSNKVTADVKVVAIF